MTYLKENLLRGLRTSPLRAPAHSWALLPAFAVLAIAVGLSTDLLRYSPLTGPATAVLPFTLFVFPSLLEEAFFRGVLIPRATAEHGRLYAAQIIAVSTVLFVLWHPANALAFNHSAIPLFLDPWFLLIVAALGVTCGYAYVVSQSLWVPVVIHWGTVTVWVLFFGGRNLILEL